MYAVWESEIDDEFFVCVMCAYLVNVTTISRLCVPVSVKMCTTAGLLKYTFEFTREMGEGVHSMLKCLKYEFIKFVHHDRVINYHLNYKKNRF